MAYKNKAFIALEVFFLIIGILLITSAATGLLVTDRGLLYIGLGVFITIGASFRLISAARAPGIGRKT
ncbi:hypothetical protein [Alkalicoccus halolimnae]|uniref:Uncharacterized protein n=1 Tax=Alkalicoccus halolimnae TaxID=1667239 RepID=A0A5C7F1W7_9BACI|nr:hypothetical protein [Alkalicoccus halolimnae]TXF82508.1 hypothetical protein FTX54_14325 [Alkalicoccus halolimnae]